MKIKTTLTIFAVIIVLAITSILAPSQTGDLTPNAPVSFSVFSLPQNLGPNVNTPGSSNELSMIAPSGLSFYFMSNNRSDGTGGNDIYLSQRATLSSAWGPAQNLIVLNTQDNENPGSISPDGRELIFYSNRAGSVGGPDIWLTTRTDPNNDFGWTTPVNLGPVINTTFSEQTPTYFVDPATGAGTLFFSSDRDSGTTNIKDIYQSTRNPNGTFNPPTPISVLNTTADENRPALSPDGLEMFFGSNRTGTRGIYVSTRASTTSQWNSPIPVGTLNNGGVAAQPSLSADGTVIYFTSNRPGGTAINDFYSAVRVSVNPTPTADFDGDGRADISIFRPADGNWWVMNSGTGTVSARQFGVNGDKIVPGDYDGDARTDFAVFRPSNGVWWILRSSDNTFSTTQWGISTDKPVAADYDGDGRTDIAVFRNGTWWILQTTGGVSVQQFGLASDIPVPAVSSN